MMVHNPKNILASQWLIQLFHSETRLNEFRSVTARKDDANPIQSIFDHRISQKGHKRPLRHSRPQYVPQGHTTLVSRISVQGGILTKNQISVQGGILIKILEYRVKTGNFINNKKDF